MWAQKARFNCNFPFFFNLNFNSKRMCALKIWKETLFSINRWYMYVIKKWIHFTNSLWIHFISCFYGESSRKFVKISHNIAGSEEFKFDFELISRETHNCHLVKYRGCVFKHTIEGVSETLNVKRYRRNAKR